jgi:hypothetical protein
MQPWVRRRQVVTDVNNGTSGRQPRNVLHARGETHISPINQAPAVESPQLRSNDIYRIEEALQLEGGILGNITALEVANLIADLANEKKHAVLGALSDAARVAVNRHNQMNVDALPKRGMGNKFSEQTAAQPPAP